MVRINLSGARSRDHISSFCNWIDDKDNTMMPIFGSAVFHRGREYLQRVKIRNVKDGLVKAKAFGQSEIPYKLEIRYEARLACITGDCDCPFGGDCKHLVALLLKIRKFSESKMSLFMMMDSSSISSRGVAQTSSSGKGKKASKRRGYDDDYGDGGGGGNAGGGFQLPILDVGELDDMSSSLRSHLMFLPRMELIQLVQRFAPITFKQGIQRLTSKTPQQLSNSLDDIKVEFSELLKKTDYQSAKGFEMALGVLLDDLRPYITIDPPSVLVVLQSVVYGTDAKLSRGELFSSSTTQGGGGAGSDDDDDDYPIIDNGDNDDAPSSGNPLSSSDFNGRDLVSFAADFVLSQPDEYQCRYFRAVYNAMCDTQYMCEIDVTSRILKVHQLHNAHNNNASADGSDDRPLHLIPRPQMSTALIALLVKEKTFTALSDLARSRFHETFPLLYAASKNRINNVATGAKRGRECYTVEDSDDEEVVKVEVIKEEYDDDDEERDDNQTIWTTSTTSDASPNSQ